MMDGGDIEIVSNMIYDEHQVFVFRIESRKCGEIKRERERERTKSRNKVCSF